MVKLNSKSTVWYRPDLFAEGGYEPPATYDDFVALADQITADGGHGPHCAGAAGTWTLTDWFESIYIRQSGVDAYDTLFSPDGNWTDQSVKDAINLMLELLTDENIAGGKEGALATTFTDGIGLTFAADATAQMYYEGGFVGGIAVGDVNPDLVWDETISFFPFPTVDGGGEGVITIGGDVMGAFTTNPGVAEFMQFLGEPEGRGRLGRRRHDHHAVRRRGGWRLPGRADAGKRAEHVYGATDVRYDGADLLAAGTDLRRLAAGDLLGSVGPRLAARDLPGWRGRRPGPNWRAKGTGGAAPPGGRPFKSVPHLRGGRADDRSDDERRTGWPAWAGSHGGWGLAASIFLAPALFLLCRLHAHPVIQTIILSFEPRARQLHPPADRRPEVP